MRSTCCSMPNKYPYTNHITKHDQLEFSKEGGVDLPSETSVSSVIPTRELQLDKEACQSLISCPGFRPVTSRSNGTGFGNSAAT